MAYFRKRGDTWQVEVKKVSPPLYASDTFPTKAAATQWANKVEAEWYAGKLGGIKDRPFSDVIKRYRDEVSPTFPTFFAVGNPKKTTVPNLFLLSLVALHLLVTLGALLPSSALRVASKVF